MRGAMQTDTLNADEVKSEEAKTEHAPVKNATDARQAESGQGGRIVLALSLTTGAIVLALIAGTILGPV